MRAPPRRAAEPDFGRRYAPKRAAPHARLCDAHSSANATNESHRREVQSFDSRRHHSPLTTDEPRE